ncbi:MAG: diguanylate cyclase [Bryobacterales bacterium]|nr:diguanylate cyclase [Bryobacterales bacterium]
MISLKRYLDSPAESLLPVAVDGYRSALAAFARGGAQVCPLAGPQFEQSLLNLKEQVSPTASPQSLAETSRRVEAELDQWTKTASDYLARTTTEVRDLVKSVAESVQSLAERDQRYAGQFTEISQKLTEVAALDNLQQMRQSLSESIRNVNASVERMVSEGQQSVASLKSQIDSYQARLAETERLAARDPLTGLDNRLGIEHNIELLLARGQPFTVILIDLNGFKPVNDQYGHIAGDSILKQFAAELRPLFRPTDAVGRWGGDEFIVVAGCEPGEITPLVERIRQWVFGDYSVDTPTGPAKVPIGGAIGTAASQPSDNVQSLIGRADSAMYADKAARRAS